MRMNMILSSMALAIIAGTLTSVEASKTEGNKSLNKKEHAKKFTFCQHFMRLSPGSTCERALESLRTENTVEDLMHLGCIDLDNKCRIWFPELNEKKDK